jgi:glycine cleavage system H lipoate-binding protein
MKYTEEHEWLRVEGDHVVVGLRNMQRNNSAT